MRIHVDDQRTGATIAKAAAPLQAGGPANRQRLEAAETDGRGCGEHMPEPLHTQYPGVSTQHLGIATQTRDLHIIRAFNTIQLHLKALWLANSR